jgi:hypothetical protein
MLHKLANVYWEYGLVFGLLYGLDRTLERLSSRMRLYVYQRVGPVEIMAATVWPYLHVSCSRSSRAQLRLSSSSI